MTVDGAAVGNTVKEPTLGDLPTTAMPPTFAANLYGDHVLTLTAAGNLAPSAPAPGNVSAIDPTLLLDLMIYIEYRFQ